MKAGFLNGKLSIKQVISRAEEIFHTARWLNGVVICPYCGEYHKIYQSKEGYYYKCGNCNRRFSDRTKTLLHGSKLSTETWMQGIYEIFTDNFISSVRLAIKLHINQKSAWLMLCKIRMSLLQDDYVLDGIIAQDEMYLGGCLSNYHYERKLRLLRENNYILPEERKYSKDKIFALNSFLKQPVFGLNNGNKIVLYATPNPIKSSYIKDICRKHVSGDAITVADESGLYNDWEGEIHTNNHNRNQYVSNEGYSSNKIENTFSWFKRGYMANVTHCKYHQLYLNEFVFRFNTKDLNHSDRFYMALKFSIGRCITYKDIKKYNSLKSFKTKKKRGLTDEQIHKILSCSIIKCFEQNHKIYTK